MRLYNPEQYTLAATPRGRKQFTPKSFLPTPGVAGTSRKHTAPRATVYAARSSLDSSCRHSHETDSTASTRTGDEDQAQRIPPINSHATSRSSKYRMICQSPLPRRPIGNTNAASDTVFTPPRTAHRRSPSDFSDFHFDIDDGFGSPFSASSLYSLDHPPPSFDIEEHNKDAKGTQDVEAASLDDAKEDRSTCSSSTISSCTASHALYSQKVERATSPLRRDMSTTNALDAQAESTAQPAVNHLSETKGQSSVSLLNASTIERRSSPTSKSPTSSSYATHPAEYASTACSSAEASTQSVMQGMTPPGTSPGRASKPSDRHCISQAASFESSFEHVKDGESIVIMIHRKDPKTGICKMRSYFRDERGRWSKFVS